jgi:hypothetical protein
VAIPNSGVVPGSGSIYNELTSVTRRAFMPTVTVQIYYSTPTMMMLMKNAQRSAGGLSQITGPVQGNSMVQGSWASYSGNFNRPQVIPGLQNFQFNTSYFLVPVPLVLGEALLQSTEELIPILDVRMNDVKAVMTQQMGSALFTNNSANPLMPNSFYDAFDNGTNVGSYGGISRTSSTNSFWKGQYYGAAGAILTRKALAAYLIQITDVAGGEAPDFVVMSPSDYATLQQDFIGVEQQYITPSSITNPTMGGLDIAVRSAFANLVINGIPFFADHWCPKGTIYVINSKYTSMYLSEDAPFAFSGFYSGIPLFQIAQVGVAIVGYQVITTKPVSGAKITGITGGAF